MGASPPSTLFRSPEPMLLPSRGILSSIRDTRQAHKRGLSFDATEYRHRVVGLHNLGNTCYFNTTIQCLYALPVFRLVCFSQSHESTFATDLLVTKRRRRRRELLDSSSRSDSRSRRDPTRTRVETHFVNLVLTMSDITTGHRKSSMISYSRRRAVIENPEQLYHAFMQSHASQFDMFAQEDLHDALLLLLDDICRLEWNIHPTFNRVRISDVCQGVFESTLRCGACHSYTSSRCEVFRTLSLPINSTCRSLGSCLERFEQEEVLASPLRCPECAQSTTFTKQIRIIKWPKVLMVQLERFDFSTGEARKIQQDITFPVNWTLPERWTSLYRLHAIGNHYGHSAARGHYTAVVEQSNQKWYEMNDTRSSTFGIKAKSLSRKYQKTAYVLFYAQA